MSEWMPIETAPVEPFNKEQWFRPHSPYVLIYTGRISIGHYSYTERGKGRWIDDMNYVAKPTHWMPLPPPPQGA